MSDLPMPAAPSGDLTALASHITPNTPKSSSMCSKEPITPSEPGNYCWKQRSLSHMGTLKSGRLPTAVSR